MDKKLRSTKMISLARNEFWTEIPETAGIYLIHACSNQVPVKLNRVTGVDEKGILYIGKSKNIRDRLRMLWRVLNPKLKATAHTFGTKYNSNKKLRESFPVSSLFISCRTTNEPKILESKLLNNYFTKFGEVPPFNSSK